MRFQGKKLGQFIFEYLHEQGVGHAFGIPGDFVLPTYRYLDKSSIEITTLTHEPSVGFAADCYARATGLGVAVVTYCVGGLNMVNSVACAYAEKSPLLVISGGPSVEDRIKDPMVHHKVRDFETQFKIYKELTCASTILLDEEAAAQEIMRVVEAVRHHSRPGYIEIPFNMVDRKIPVPKFQSQLLRTQSDAQTLSACAEHIVSRINESERPVIVAGVELHRHRLNDYALELSHRFNIPIAATLMGKSVVRETDPNYIGVYSGVISEDTCRDYVHNSDCVLLLGAFISDVLLGFYASRLEQHSTISLQTDKIRVGYQHYEDALLPDILKRLIDSPITPRDPVAIDHPRDEYVRLPEARYHEPMKSETIFEQLSIRLNDTSAVVCDTGDALIGAIGIRTSKRSRFFADAYYLSMGFAVPAAIGLMRAHPDHRVFAIVGDGAFQMTGMEISTAAKYGLTPIVIVINNDGYGTQRHIVDGTFNDITRWKYHKIPEMMGYGKGVQVKTKGEFVTALDQAIEADVMTLIEVVVPREECSPPLRRMGEALGKLRRND